MIKIIEKNSIYFIGKVSEIRGYLDLLPNKNMLLIDYLRQYHNIYIKSLN